MAPPRGSCGIPWGARGRPWGALGVHWGSLGGASGALREHFWQTGGPVKSLVLLNRLVHFGSRKRPWGTMVGEVEAKTGGDESNGDRGAHKKTKTKRARADEEKEGPQGPPKEGSTIRGPGPPLGRSVCFICIRPMFLLASLGRSEVLLGASGGGLGGPRAPPGAAGGPPGGQEHPTG
jgi:hypothetical protein